MGSGGDAKVFSKAEFAGSTRKDHMSCAHCPKGDLNLRVFEFSLLDELLLMIHEIFDRCPG